MDWRSEMGRSWLFSFFFLLIFLDFSLMHLKYCHNKKFKTSASQVLSFYKTKQKIQIWSIITMKCFNKYKLHGVCFVFFWATKISTSSCFLHNKQQKYSYFWEFSFNGNSMWQTNETFRNPKELNCPEFISPAWVREWWVCVQMEKWFNDFPSASSCFSQQRQTGESGECENRMSVQTLPHDIIVCVCVCMCGFMWEEGGILRVGFVYKKTNSFTFSNWSNRSRDQLFSV